MVPPVVARVGTIATATAVKGHSADLTYEIDIKADRDYGVVTSCKPSFKCRALTPARFAHAHMLNSVHTHFNYCSLQNAAKLHTPVQVALNANE